MTKINENHVIWEEKYRPQTCQDLILGEETKNKILEWVKTGEVPHLVLCSSNPGLGKTSLAKAIIHDIGAEYIYINASLENGIDVIRNKIQKFASTISLEGKLKIILLDEADGLSSSSQDSLKAFIEEFSATSRFFFTSNHKNKLSIPLINRCQLFDFDILFEQDKKELGPKMIERLEFILKNEGVSYNIEDLQFNVFKPNFPSFRAMVLLCQKCSQNKVLSVGKAECVFSNSYDGLINLLGERNFPEYRRQIKKMHDVRGFYEYCFENLDTVFADEEDNIAKAIELLYEYSRDLNIGAIRDYEISLASFGAKIMINDIVIKGHEPVM